MLTSTISRRRVLQVAGTALSSSAIFDHSHPRASRRNDALVGAHYYPWYGPNNHWSNGYRGTPVLGEYDSRSPTVIDKHVEWAASHGIDWFSVSWWGPDSYSGRTLRRYLAPKLEGTDVQFSALYEPKGRLTYQNGIADLDNPENRRQLVDDITHIASTYSDNSNYLRIDGRPVLYVYIARTFGGDVAGAFAEAQRQADQEFYLIGDYGRLPQAPNLDVYDAVSPYNMYHASEGIDDGFVDEVDGLYKRWRLLADELDFTFAPITLPGFDNTNAAWGDEDAPVLTRKLERYGTLCDLAREYMNPDQPIALVTSFNEWHEYTSIEPGESFETKYLEQTDKRLAHGSIGGGVGSLVQLTFFWKKSIEESSINSAVSKANSRDLTIQVNQLKLLNSSGETLVAYDVGDDPEPIFTQGVSGSGQHKDATWRWFVAGPRMRTHAYIPESIAESTQSLEITGRAAGPEFSFDVALGESTERTTVTLPDHHATIRFQLAGQQTPTPSPTATPSPTSSPTATPSPTSSPTATPSPTSSPTATPPPTSSPTATPDHTSTSTDSPSSPTSSTSPPAPTDTAKPSAKSTQSNHTNSSTQSNSPGLSTVIGLAGLTGGVAWFHRRHKD